MQKKVEKPFLHLTYYISLGRPCFFKGIVSVWRAAEGGGPYITGLERRVGGPWGFNSRGRPPGRPEMKGIGSIWRAAEGGGPYITGVGRRVGGPWGFSGQKAGHTLRQKLRQLGVAPAGQVHAVHLVELTFGGVQEVGPHQTGGLLIVFGQLPGLL